MMFSSMLAIDDVAPGASLSITPGVNNSTYDFAPTDIQSVSKVPAGEQAAISASGKHWKFPSDLQVTEDLVEAAGGSVFLAGLLAARGIATASQARTFLDPLLYVATSPMEFSDMPAAIVRINQAIAEQEQITIYGDYDVDGITGTSVLLSVLRALGAKVDYYIPNRTGEGYGLNLKAVSILASKHRTKLIITCDCGISNFAEINFARSFGLDTIIADHHTMPDLLPPAVAILHPKRLPEDHPLYHLPGVGVAYKLCEALLIDKGLPQKIDELLDFVTLGMIADLVPLVKENRYLVQIGLPKLIASPRPGIKALLSQVSNNGGTDLVGFGLAPRINAVGRLSDANLAVELMTTDDPELSAKLAQRLQTENSRRQELCDKIFLEADHMVSTRIDLDNSKAIVIYKEDWHHGVVGIVASRLVEKYHRPVFIGELDTEEGLIRGSARGVNGIDLFQVLKANEQLMIKWGGHKMAAGFSLEAAKGETFCQALTATCNQMLAQSSLTGLLEIDAVIDPQLVSIDLVNLLSRLGPFGMSNKKPVLVMQNLVCQSTRLLGKEGKHSRIILQKPSSNLEFEAVLWNSKGRIPSDGLNLDVAFTPEINSYNGRDRLQLVLADWHTEGLALSEVQAKERIQPVAEQVPLEKVPAFNRQPVAGETPPNAVPPDVVTPIESPIVASEYPEAAEANPSQTSKRQLGTTSMDWKDLRNHESPQNVLQAAIKKLGNRVSIFGESCPKIPGIDFVDRNSLETTQHLLVWQFPPAQSIFCQLLLKSQARNIYLVGGHAHQVEEPKDFLKRLFGLVRFAVNQKEGKAEGDKLASALAATKMSVALGLTILRKLHAIDWFVEDGLLYLDVLETPAGAAEETDEYRQLASSLKESFEFRNWCSGSSLKDIQLKIVPNHIEVVHQPTPFRRQDVDRYENPTEAHTVQLSSLNND